jgi:hypothetical protein
VLHVAPTDHATWRGGRCSNTFLRGWGKKENSDLALPSLIILQFWPLTLHITNLAKLDFEVSGNDGDDILLYHCLSTYETSNFWTGSLDVGLAFHNLSATLANSHAKEFSSASLQEVCEPECLTACETMISSDSTPIVGTIWPSQKLLKRERARRYAHLRYRGITHSLTSSENN